eukprot:1188215-Prorocentrum_minimum.AAC.3
MSTYTFHYRCATCHRAFPDDKDKASYTETVLGVSPTLLTNGRDNGKHRVGKPKNWKHFRARLVTHLFSFSFAPCVFPTQSPAMHSIHFNKGPKINVASGPRLGYWPYALALTSASPSVDVSTQSGFVRKIHTTETDGD